MTVAERKERDRQELRQLILDAARELFVHDGYESVSMRKIADKIEYSPATIYTYFKDKDDILDCLCEETFFHLYERQHAVHDGLQGDALEHLKKGLETYIRFGLEHPEHYIVTFLLKSPPPEDDAAGESRMAKAGQQCFDGLRGAVRRCMEEGKIRNADLEETSQAMWAGAHGLTALLITQTCFPFVERDRLIHRMVEILVKGVTS
jgi:AcrR family transcriptional regulator